MLGAFSIVGLLFDGAAAQTTETWTPSSVLRRVQSGHPALKAAKFETEGAAQFLKGAGKQPNPLVRMAVTKGTTPEDANYLLQTIEVAGQPRLRKRIASQGLDKAGNQQLITLREVSLDALRGYYDLWLAQRRVAIIGTRLERTQELEELAQARLDAGDISQNEFRRARLERWNSEAQLVNEKGALASKEASLRTLLNLPESEPLNLPEEIVPPRLEVTLPDLDSMLAGVDELPDVKMARAQARQKGLEADLAGKAGVPSLFVYAYRADYSRVANSGIALGVSFPLFDWGSLGAETALLRSQALAADKDADSVALRWRRSLSEAYQQYQGRLQQLALLEDQAKEMEVLSGHALTSYKVGYSSILDVLVAQRDYQNYLLLYVEQLAAIEKQKLELYWLSAGEIVPQAEESDP